MRPEILFPLFRPVGALKGIGERLAKLMERAAGPRVVDLLWHLPAGLIDRRFRPRIAEAPLGRIATIVVEVERHQPPANRRQPYRVRCRDETGYLTLVFFKADATYLERLLPVGQSRIVSGTVQDYGGERQMAHPDHVLPPEELQRLPALEPVYPLTAGLSGKVVARAVEQVLQRLPALPEWHEVALLRLRGWPAWPEAVVEAHRPGSALSLDPASPARARLAYDELLANQLALALLRRGIRRAKGRSLKGDGHLRQAVLAALPFQPTGAQSRCLAEIEADLVQPTAMLRLLQGDVGSGKTLVALLAMLAAVEAGTQAVLMAPTDLLARQHFQTLLALAQPAGVRLELVTGREGGKARQAALLRLAEGAAELAVGTHALFQEDVAFRDLGLVVIDEQHRFGVHQRLTLARKGEGVDVLVMTATPIPRTLALTAYGDMDVSRLDEKPPGRAPIDTRTVPLARLGDVVAAAGRALAGGHRIYWVCPLVAVSEELDVAAAEERHAVLKKQFGEAVGLVHGAQPPSLRDRTMAAFTEGRIGLLVATTVIEVGVDVPEATVMVVEHAERFGLTQLHQLRGRVGRGGRPGTCLLLFAEPLGDTARARLAILRETDDGFRIAEEDLRLRGPGELLGTRQSGLPDFRLVEPERHGDLMQMAHDDVRLTLERDAELASPRGQALRTLLYLFERDAAARYLRSG